MEVRFDPWTPNAVALNQESLQENVDQTAEEIMPKQFQTSSKLVFQLKRKPYVEDLRPAASTTTSNG